MTLPDRDRNLWLAISLLAGAVVAEAAMSLSWVLHVPLAQVLLVGGGAFAGAVVLFLAMIQFATRS